MMILTFILYYIISIFTVLLGIYFYRFTKEDYENNPALRRKCRYVIIWTFMVALILQNMIIGPRTLFIYPVTDPTIPLLAVLFNIAYVILLGRMLTPKPTRKKRKKFK